MVQVLVESSVPGAQPVASETEETDGTSAFLRLFASPAYAQGGFTLPGATVTAYVSSGEIAATATVDAQGRARFENLPPGTYRFVITTSDPGVVLQTVATTSPTGEVSVQADSMTTAATLLTLQMGQGRFDATSYSSALAYASSLSDPVVQTLLQQVNTGLQNGTVLVSPDGRTVTDQALASSLQTAASMIPMLDEDIGIPGQGPRPTPTPGTTAGSTAGTSGMGGTSTTGGTTAGTSGMGGTSTTAGTTAGTSGTAGTTAGTSGMGGTSTTGGTTAGTSGTAGTTAGTSGMGGTSTTGGIPQTTGGTSAGPGGTSGGVTGTSGSGTTGGATR